MVGAGLSAADAVTICRSSEVPVIHVYRNRSAGLDKMLPENVYPEYHAVHKMMKESSRSYDLYTPLSEHTIVDVSAVSTVNGSHTVTVQNLKTGETRQLEVSYCAILIGSRPDLRFLTNIGNSTNYAPDELNSHLHMADCGNLTQQKSNNKLIEQSNDEQQWSMLSKRIAWLKNLCVKCKHLNFCEWSRRNNYKRICGHNTGKNCECPRMVANSTTMTISYSDNKQQNNMLLKDEHLSMLELGEDPLKPIDCKSNPIAVNKYTNEVLRTPRGLYSMGPLVGDNFVRFIPGGALAVTSALHREND